MALLPFSLFFRRVLKLYACSACTSCHWSPSFIVVFHGDNFIIKFSFFSLQIRCECVVTRFQHCSTHCCIVTFCVVTFRVNDVVTFRVGKLLHFALKERWKLLHFGLMLHFALIVTFCGVTPSLHLLTTHYGNLRSRSLRECHIKL